MSGLRSLEGSADWIPDQLVAGSTHAGLFHGCPSWFGHTSAIDYPAESLMLAVTPTATQVIGELVQRRGFGGGAGLRIATAEEPEQGFSLRVTAAPEANDEVVPIHDHGVFLDPQAAKALDGKVLDATVGPEGKVSFSVVDQSMQ